MRQRHGRRNPKTEIIPFTGAKTYTRKIQFYLTSTQYALCRYMPYIARNEYTTYAHEKSHEQVNFVIIKYAKAVPNVAARIVAPLVRRCSRTSDRYLSKSDLSLPSFIDTYLLTTRPFYHFPSPRINDTCLKPTTKCTIQHTSQTTPYRDCDYPIDLLLQAPSISSF